MEKRRLKILELIAEYEIENQGELVLLLNGLGFGVTQATVSRDIKELKLIKVPGKLKSRRYIKDRIELGSRQKNLFRECVVSIKNANNLIVIKTLSGCGSQAGIVVDALNLPDVLGSVAGDDTLLVVASDAGRVPYILSVLEGMR